MTDREAINYILKCLEHKYEWSKDSQMAMKKSRRALEYRIRTKDAYEQGKKDVLDALKLLISADYKSKETGLLMGDLLEMLEEK